MHLNRIFCILKPRRVPRDDPTFKDTSTFTFEHIFQHLGKLSKMASSPPKPSRSPKSSKSPRGRFAWLSSKDRDKKGKSPEKPQPGSDRVKKSGDDARERASAWPLEDYFKQAPMVMEEDDPEKVDPKQVSSELLTRATANIQ